MIQGCEHSEVTASGVGDGVVVVVQPQREKALLHVLPQPLDRVELGRVGRQRDERDVGRHPQCIRAVSSGLVEDQDDVLVLADRTISRVSCFLARVRSRNSWIGCGGTKLARIRPCASRSAIQVASFMSLLARVHP